MERFSIEYQQQFAFALVLHYFALWFVKEKKVTFHFHQSESKNQNQLWLDRTRFPAFDACYVYLLPGLIGSMRYLCPLWLVSVIVLVLVLRHAIETCATANILLKWLNLPLLYSGYYDVNLTFSNGDAGTSTLISFPSSHLSQSFAPRDGRRWDPGNEVVSSLPVVLPLIVSQ